MSTVTQVIREPSAIHLEDSPRYENYNVWQKRMINERGAVGRTCADALLEFEKLLKGIEEDLGAQSDSSLLKTLPKLYVELFERRTLIAILLRRAPSSEEPAEATIILEPTKTPHGNYVWGVGDIFCRDVTLAKRFSALQLNRRGA